MNKDVKELLKSCKRRAIVWSLFAVTACLLGVGMIVMMCVIPEIPDWAMLLIGIITFVSGQASISFLTIVSLENDNITDLENYLNKMEELDI